MFMDGWLLFLDASAYVTFIINYYYFYMTLF